MEIDIQRFVEDVLVERVNALVAAAPRASSDDIEGVHDVRVASRRLRAALGLFESLLQDRVDHRAKSRHIFADYEAIELTVRRVTQTLGKARDLDVLITAIKRLATDLPRAGQSPVRSFVRDLEKRRHSLQPKVASEMRRLLKGDLTQQVDQLLRSGAFELPEQASEWPRNAIAGRVAALQALSGCLKKETAIARHHAMRIEAKRLRYTLEIFLPYLGDAGANALELVKKLQELLGEVHDSDVMAPLLTRLFRSTVRTETKVMPIGAVGLKFADNANGISSLIIGQREKRHKSFFEAGTLWEQIQTSACLENVIQQASI